MKRTELHVGDVLYHAAPRTWNSDYFGEKAVVVDVEPYKVSRWGRGDDRYVKTDKGPGVLVELGPRGGRPYRAVVTLAHLRGPYEAVVAEVKARAEAQRARVAEQVAKRNAVKTGAGAVAERARNAGFAPYGVLQEGALIALAPDVLARLLDAAGVPQSDAAPAAAAHTPSEGESR